jgi:hypothetical protein
MRISAPIFLNCLSRGGSNILWNLFLSHEGACSPIFETLEIFSTDIRRPSLAGIGCALLAGQPRLFGQWHLRDRRPLNRFAAAAIDRTLYRHKMNTATDPEMRYKQPDVEYTRDEVAAARLVAKNNNGLTFLADVLASIYPDATSFALVRHPLALYEGHRRRGLARDPEHFAGYYKAIVSRMLRDAGRMDRYSVIRFEALVARPFETAELVYRIAGLEPTTPERLRFKAKPHFRVDGSYGTGYQKNRHYWLTRAEAAGFFESDVNRLQVGRLDAAERAAVLEPLAEICDQLGYGAGADEIAPPPSGAVAA